MDCETPVIETTQCDMEDQTHEWKLSWNDRCLMDVCAMYNSQGGMLTVGRTDDGTFVGVEDPCKLIEIIRHDVREAMHVIIEPYVETVDGKQCILVPVPNGNGAVMCGRGFRIRFWNRSACCDRDSIANLFMKKPFDSWFDQPFDITRHPLSAKLMREFIPLCIRKKAFIGDVEIETMGFLEHYHMTTNNEPALVSAMFFLERPRDIDCGAFLRIDAYGDDPTPAETREIDAPAIGMVGLAMSIISTLLREQHGLELEDAFPRETIREAIINAIIHKNYACTDPVSISIHEDRIVITNPVDKNGFWHTWDSMTCMPYALNPRLSTVFEMTGLSYGLGTGFARMRESCMDAGCPEPQFTVDEGVFTVTIPAATKLRRKKNRRKTAATAGGSKSDALPHAFTTMRHESDGCGIADGQ